MHPPQFTQNENSPAAVGARVRALRIARGLTLKAFAPLLSTDVATLSRIERGLQPMLVAHLIAAASALSVPIAVLCGEVPLAHAAAVDALRAGGTSGAAVLARVVADLLAEA